MKQNIWEKKAEEHRDLRNFILIIGVCAIMFLVRLKSIKSGKY